MYAWFAVIMYADETFSSVTNKYYYGTDLAGKLYFSGGTGGLLMTKLGDDLAYVYNNGNGHVEALYSADSENTLLAEYEYSPFGETRKKSGALADKNPIRYSSRYSESNTGLYYYGYRHYSPRTMKWLSKDPIGEMGGRNLYGYLENDSVNSTDILGHKPYASCTLYYSTHSTGALKRRGRDGNEYYIGQRRCFFRCYHPEEDTPCGNCYSIPCYDNKCKKDHGVAVLVIINATGRATAAQCSEIQEEVKNKKITGGSVARNEKNSGDGSPQQPKPNPKPFNPNLIASISSANIDYPSSL